MAGSPGMAGAWCWSRRAENAPADVPANLTLVSGYVDDADLKRLQNECGIQLWPIARGKLGDTTIVEACRWAALAIRFTDRTADERNCADSNLRADGRMGRSEGRAISAPASMSSGRR